MNRDSGGAAHQADRFWRRSLRAGAISDYLVRKTALAAPMLDSFVCIGAMRLI